MRGTVLVTGATGIVGHEVAEELERDDYRVLRTSRRGGDGVVPWNLCSERLPAALERDYFAVVHCAADIRWNMSETDAWNANVVTTQRLLHQVRCGRFVHLSTLFAVPSSPGGRTVGSFRNTYEWSKAESERLVFDHHRDPIVVRPPLIIGRRSDGYAARFNGLYTIVRSALAGLLPMIVGKEQAPVDVVATDDVASVVLAALDNAWAPQTVVRLGRSARALTLQRLNDVAFHALNDWRQERGAPAIQPPRIVNPDSWRRFYQPFADRYLSPRQMKSIEVFEPFAPYLALTSSLEVDVSTPTIEATLAGAIRYWASQHARLATATPRPWQMKGIE